MGTAQQHNANDSAFFSGRGQKEGLNSFTLLVEQPEEH